MKKRLVIFFAPILFIILFNFILSFALSSNKVSNELGLYCKPICRNDMVEYQSGTCEVCNEDIIKNGVMYSIEADNYQYSIDKSTKLVFKDYYDSWDTYKKDYNVCMFWYKFDALLIIFALSIYPATICMELYDKYRKKREENE